MTPSDQAKKGFKTFLITLSVSLVLFSFIYYIVTDSKQDINLDDSTPSKEVSAAVTPTPEVKGDSTVADAKVDSSNEKSLFAELTTTTSSTNQRTVLAGTTQSSQSSVPSTGVDSITYALVASSILLAGGVLYYIYGPRKVAINSFEREVIRSLDKDL